MNLNKQQKDKLSLLIGSIVEETAEINKEIVGKENYEGEQQKVIDHLVNKSNLVMEFANKNDGSTDDQHKERSAIIKQLENSLIKRIKYKPLGCGCAIPVIFVFLLWFLYMMFTEGF